MNIIDNIDATGIATGSSNNIIKENNIILNQFYIDIELNANPNNTIYHNNFINNNQQLTANDNPYYPIYSEFFWDNGSEGNYWSDYLTKYPNATELDDSGVWGTPYIIYYSYVDRFPLIQPFAIPSFPSP